MPYLFSTCPHVNHHLIGLGCWPALRPLQQPFASPKLSRVSNRYINNTQLAGIQSIKYYFTANSNDTPKISPNMVNWTSKEHQNYICWLQDTLKTTISRDAVQICSVPQGAPQPQPAAFAPFLAQRLRFNVKSFEHRCELLEASHGVGFPTPGPRKTIRSDRVSLFEKSPFWRYNGFLQTLSLVILRTDWTIQNWWRHQTPCNPKAHTQKLDAKPAIYAQPYILCFLIIGWSLKCHPCLKHHLNYLGLDQIWVPKRCFVFHKKWTKIISTHSHLYLRVS